MKTIGTMLLCSVSVCAAERLEYPKTRTVDHVDVLHDVRIPDPYRWLEDADSPETKAWVEAQNAVTMPYLGSLPRRETIKSRLTKLWNYERYTGVFQRAGRYFWYYNNGCRTALSCIRRKRSTSPAKC